MGDEQDMIVVHGQIQPRRYVQKRYTHQGGRWIEAYVVKDVDRLVPSHYAPLQVVMADGAERQIAACGYEMMIVAGSLVYLTVPESMLQPVTRVTMEPPGIDEMIDVPEQPAAIGQNIVTWFP